MESPINFNAKVKLTRDQSEKQIDKNEPVLVYVEAITIDTSQFCSKDLKKRREGTITLEIAGQKTVFPYKGEGNSVSAKFLNKAAYIGENPGCLGISLSIVESDAKAREAMSKGANWSDRLAKVSFLTAAHPAVGPGLGLMSSMLQILKTKVDDDCEAQAFCICDELKREEKITVEFRRTETVPALLTVILKLVGLGKTEDNLDRISVRIRNPEFNIVLEKNIPIDEMFNYSKSIITWFAQQEIGVFNFEAASGKSAYSYTNVIGDIKPALSRGIIAWDNNEIFRVKAANTAGNKKLLPLSLTFSLNPTELATEGIFDLLKQGAAFASVIAPEIKDAVQVVTKQAPNILSFLSEITSESLSLYSFNGMVVLSESENPLSVPEARGVIFAKADSENRWSVDIKEKITWREAEIGSLKFKLELVSV